LVRGRRGGGRGIGDRRCPRLDPDVVLLDIGLPDDDGFAIADRLAALVVARIVLTSSRERAVYGDRLASSAALGFIGKGELDGTALRRLVADRGSTAE
jgi:DNA-binding NarL/FixJ family response regulator